MSTSYWREREYVIYIKGMYKAMNEDNSCLSLASLLPHFYKEFDILGCIKATLFAGFFYIILIDVNISSYILERHLF